MHSHLHGERGGEGGAGTCVFTQAFTHARTAAYPSLLPACCQAKVAHVCSILRAMYACRRCAAHVGFCARASVPADEPYAVLRQHTTPLALNVLVTTEKRSV